MSLTTSLGFGNIRIPHQSSCLRSYPFCVPPSVNHPPKLKIGTRNPLAPRLRKIMFLGSLHRQDPSAHAAMPRPRPLTTSSPFAVPGRRSFCLIVGDLFGKSVKVDSMYKGAGNREPYGLTRSIYPSPCPGPQNPVLIGHMYYNLHSHSSTSASSSPMKVDSERLTCGSTPKGN